MIVRMVRVRIAGPRSLLDRTLTVLQDLNVLHVDRPPVPESAMPDRAIARQRRHVERGLADVETALARLQVPDAPSSITGFFLYAPPDYASEIDIELYNDPRGLVMFTTYAGGRQTHPSRNAPVIPAPAARRRRRGAGSRRS